MSSTLIEEEANDAAFLRVFDILFAGPARADAVAHAATHGLIRALTKFVETTITQAADDIAQLQSDVTTLASAFTAYQAQQAASAQAAQQQAADLHAQLTAAQALAAQSGTVIPPDVQSALDGAHAASQALAAQMTALTTAAASPVQQGAAAPAAVTPSPDATVAAAQAGTTSSPASATPNSAAAATSSPPAS